MKVLVKNFNAFSVWRILGKTELLKLSSLVIDVNYKHHINQNYFPQEEFFLKFTWKMLPHNPIPDFMPFMMERVKLLRQ